MITLKCSLSVILLIVFYPIPFDTDVDTDNNHFILAVPPPDEKAPEGKAGLVPRPFTYKLSKAPATPLAGGSIKIFDPSVFAVATTIVGAIVTVEPGAMR